MSQNIDTQTCSTNIIGIQRNKKIVIPKQNKRVKLWDCQSCDNVPPFIWRVSYKPETKIDGLTSGKND